MKAQLVKSLNHEVGYITTAIIIVVILSMVVFPLFILFLPILIIYGCLEIWHLDHLKKNGGKVK
ncbi:MAG: hypothetical protein AABY93_09530 [Bacteroidota bacterium]